MKEKKFTKREELEKYKEKLVNKYWIIKTEILFIHNGYLLRRWILKNV